MPNIPKKENKYIEFKERLSPKIHLKKERKEHLATQMKYKLEMGKGKALYIIGVNDEGKVVGLNEIEFEETLNVLKRIAMENSAHIEKVEKFKDNDKLIGRILITKKEKITKNHLIIGVSGHVNHGKSTLIACLMLNKPDKKGKYWLYLDILPHEIERGLSADLHYALCGFAEGKPINFKNPLDKRERARIVEKADKIISFIDTVGHESWQRTTIRGLVGQDIDYGLLVVAADDGVTHITKEHLGILLAMNLPVIVCITKIDKVGKKKIERTEEQLIQLLKNVGKVPFLIKNEDDINVVIDKLEVIVPIFKTSAVTLEGYDFLNKLLHELPERVKDLDKPFLMFIDKVYNITGVGTVVSGTVKQGKLIPGKVLLIGPDKSGQFRKVKATSIEMHYQRLSEANAGFIVGIALRGVKHKDVERGMILCDPDLKPKAVKSFEAEILVLHHPTRIASGYEPVFHCNTIAESVKIRLLNKSYLKAGETGNVIMSFRYKPQFVIEGDRFVFREGKTKGIGTITKIVKFV
jgi:elongation factor 1-alpha